MTPLQEAVMSMQSRSPARARALSPSILLLALTTALGGAAIAQAPERSGKEVVDAVCASCHAAGKDKAPRIGDAKAWAKRSSQGLTALTAHAITGIRKMPAHGGSSGVSDLELQRAIAYMVNRSGGHWVEPQAAGALLQVRTSESIVENQCSTCHRDGKDGAPKLGDRAAWTPRMAKGLDTLVANAVHGHGPMPARGGMPDLSSAEIRGAILYMFNFGLPPLTEAPIQAEAPDPHHQVLAGTDVWFGMMRAESVPGAAKVPSGKGYYHLNISLADNRTHARLKDAQVTMSVSDGMSVQTKALDPVVANDAVSWGNYFKFDSGSAYNITAQIKRPGQRGAILANFEFKAP
jgi:cytochrome c5